MSNQNYCMVNKETNICDNVCIWDGNFDTWTPPDNYLMLLQENTPAKNWQWNQDQNIWELTIFDFGGIGYTWDGTFLVTNEPKPAPIVQS